MTAHSTVCTSTDGPCNCGASDVPQTALLLTKQEWDDLAHMVQYYRLSTFGATSQAVRREHALAERIIEANQ